ncbi:TPA: hypothetical protein N6490_000266 [Escherichia coli]|nr:hypothetical protein [Escherichia coli]
MYSDDTKQRRYTDAMLMEAIASTVGFHERHGSESSFLLTSLLRHIHDELALRVDERVSLELPEGLPDYQAPVTSAYDTDDWEF